MKNKKNKKLTAVISTVCVAVLIIVAAYVLICSFTGNVPYFGGYAAIRIISPSMEPTIPTGSYILVHKVDAEEIEENDVIMFVSHAEGIEGKLNTHRVIEITEENGERLFATKGDNNTLKDKEKTKATDVVGRYEKNLPVLTDIASWFRKPWVYLLFILIPACILLGSAALDVRKQFKAAQHEAAVEAEIKKIEAEKQKGDENVPKDQTEKKDP